jgi:hypothetical protein
MVVVPISILQAGSGSSLGLGKFKHLLQINLTLILTLNHADTSGSP